MQSSVKLLGKVAPVMFAIKLYVSLPNYNIVHSRVIKLEKCFHPPPPPLDLVCRSHPPPHPLPFKTWLKYL